MTRRCVTIHLDPGCEVPATRSFKRPDLVREVLRERGRYVSAALTIVRAWIVAGRPKTACKSLAGYGDWSDLCRQPLLWLGYADPAASVFEAMAEDPDRETLARLLNAWHTVFGRTPTMVRDVVRQASFAGDENVEMREVLHDIADERGEINRRKLGDGSNATQAGLSIACALSAPMATARRKLGGSNRFCRFLRLSPRQNRKMSITPF
jgi:hypothetical protein